VTEGLETLSLKEAFAVAVAEGGEATPTAVDAGQPPVEAQATETTEPASADPSEQPAGTEGATFDDAAHDLSKSLMSDTGDTQDSSEPGIVPGSDEFWNLGVEVNTPEGPQTVTVNELSDGYLRQADYTRKTQALAEQRKYTERAEDFFKAFSDDPAGFSRSLAVQAGLIGEGDSPVREVPSAKIPTVEEIDAQVEELVKSRIEDDPRVKSAAMRDAENQIDDEFDRLETVFEIPLPPELRRDLVNEAYRTGASDLEGLLAKRLVHVQQQQSRAGVTRQATTSRPGTSPSGATDEVDVNRKPKDMRDAWEMSKVAAAQQ